MCVHTDTIPAHVLYSNQSSFKYHELASAPLPPRYRYENVSTTYSSTSTTKGHKRDHVRVDAAAAVTLDTLEHLQTLQRAHSYPREALELVLENPLIRSFRGSTSTCILHITLS